MENLKPMGIKDLPKCFGQAELACINKCQIWESCLRKQGTNNKEVKL